MRLSNWRCLLGAAYAISLLLSPTAGAEATFEVAAPYIELRTGPGRGYPVFHVAEEGEPVELIKRRTNWLKVRTGGRQPRTGWVRRAEIEAAMRTDTDVFELPGVPATDRWEWAVTGGDFAGASAISTALAFNMTPNISLRLQGSQVLGEFSDALHVSGSVRMRPFANWRIRPWAELGGGVLQTEPFSTIVDVQSRNNPTLSVGGGIDVRLAGQFVLTCSYRRHTVLTNRETNEELDEWKLGIATTF